MSFQVYRCIKDDPTLKYLGRTFEDWDAGRKYIKDERGRSRGEQMVVLWGGMIYAVERRDGNGFAMVHQDRQNAEDAFWYPDERVTTKLTRDQVELLRGVVFKFAASSELEGKVKDEILALEEMLREIDTPE